MTAFVLRHIENGRRTVGETAALPHRRTPRGRRPRSSRPQPVTFARADDERWNDDDDSRTPRPRWTRRRWRRLRKRTRSHRARGMDRPIVGGLTVGRETAGGTDRHEIYAEQHLPGPGRARQQASSSRAQHSIVGRSTGPRSYFVVVVSVDYVTAERPGSLKKDVARPQPAPPSRSRDVLARFVTICLIVFPPASDPLRDQNVSVKYLLFFLISIRCVTCTTLLRRDPSSTDSPSYRNPYGLHSRVLCTVRNALLRNTEKNVQNPAVL